MKLQNWALKDSPTNAAAPIELMVPMVPGNTNKENVPSSGQAKENPVPLPALKHSNPDSVFEESVEVNSLKCTAKENGADALKSKPSFESHSSESAMSTSASVDSSQSSRGASKKRSAQNDAKTPNGKTPSKKYRHTAGILSSASKLQVRLTRSNKKTKKGAEKGDTRPVPGLGEAGPTDDTAAECNQS